MAPKNNNNKIKHKYYLVDVQLSKINKLFMLEESKIKQQG